MDAGSKPFSYFEYSTPDDGQQNVLWARRALIEGGGFVVDRNLFHAFGYNDGHNEPTWGRRFVTAWPRVMGDHRRVGLPLDLNGDGARDVADLVTFVNGPAMPGHLLPRADADGSGAIDAADGHLLRQSVLGAPGWWE